jgi:Domain of unknown function (DUF5615)
VKGLLADINVRGQVEYLIERMQAPPWAEFWQDLGLVLFHFDEVGLTPTSSDWDIWLRCQAEELILVTNNRTDKTDDSLEAVIRNHNTANSLPVLTIANLDKLRQRRTFTDKVIERMLEYLDRIDTVRGTGRLYLP